MAESRESHELSRMGFGGHPRGHADRGTWIWTKQSSDASGDALKRYLLGQTSGIKWWKQWDFTSDDWDFRWFSWPEGALVSSLTSYFWLIYSYPGASHVLFLVCCWFPTLELATILSKIHGSPDSLSFINAAAFPSSPIWAPIFLWNTYLGLQFDDRIYNLLLIILWYNLCHSYSIYI